MCVGSGRLETTHGQSRLRFYLQRVQGSLQVREIPAEGLGLSPRVVVKRPRAAHCRSFLLGLTHLKSVFQELLRRSLPLAQRLPPLGSARSVLQPLPTPGTFLKAWIVLPHSCRHVDVAYPGHTGSRAREVIVLEPLIRHNFPTVPWWDKRWFCSSLRLDVREPCACPS